MQTLKYFIKTKKDRRIPGSGDKDCLTTFKHIIDKGLFIYSEELESNCPSAYSKYDTNDSSTLDQLLTLSIHWEGPSREETFFVKGHQKP